MNTRSKAKIGAGQLKTKETLVLNTLVLKGYLYVVWHPGWVRFSLIKNILHGQVVKAKQLASEDGRPRIAKNCKKIFNCVNVLSGRNDFERSQHCALYTS